MRIVADTNVVISGLLWRGPQRQVLELARQRRITLCTSADLLAELAEVIGRPKFAQRILAAGLSPAVLVKDFGQLAVVVDSRPLPGPICRDPDDDRIIACAVGAEATIIVSGDQDLLTLGHACGIRILAAVSALNEMTG